jgi:hypothetical protein
VGSFKEVGRLRTTALKSSPGVPGETAAENGEGHAGLEMTVDAIRHYVQVLRGSKVQMRISVPFMITRVIRRRLPMCTRKKNLCSQVVTVDAGISAWWVE